ncbi:MAG TPA: beta-ketoacyl synthase N-terminal-like domain-containing protein [Streptosporangiaceae bacterium]
MTTIRTRLMIGDFQTTVRPGDPLVADHRIHGVPVLPGVALLDAVVRAAALGGCAPAEIELANVLFEAPVTLPDGVARRLVFRSHEHGGDTRVVVETHVAGAETVPDDATAPTAECLVRPVSAGRPPQRLDVAAARQALAGAGARPMEDLYAITAGLGIEHRDFLRARGTVAAHDGGLVAELTLGAAATRRRADFAVPPTYLDAAIVVAVADALRGAAAAYLPVYLSRFRMWDRPGDRVFVVTQPGGALRRGDALETDLSLHDQNGRLIARLERLTAMRASGSSLTGTATAVQSGTAPAGAEPVPPPAPAATTAAVPRPRPSRRLQIAVVGMSGRYPGADDLDQLWSNLEARRDTAGRVPADRWNPGDYENDGRRLSRFGGFLDDVDAFDPGFFRIPPSMAALLDPQERLFLEAAYGAIENAGYQPDDFAPPHNQVGVFVGASWTDYRILAAEAAREQGTPTTLSSLSSIANRVSYTFNLVGPSLAVDTACSASLTALHLACRSLAEGECDAAVAGGVNLLLHPEKYVVYGQLDLVSTDGKLRSFGAGGTGHVPGEGVGALFLKPLDRALADGDTVHGVILATAINHGGQAAGFTVPQPEAQGAVIARALAEGGVDPETIGYIEAHGTGTALGDPVEVCGLVQAYAGRTTPLPVGSIKSNVGHLESAAGVLGVTRALLQLRHGRITASLHSEELNPDIDFGATPFYVPQRGEPWHRPVVSGAEQPRRCGISSFGAGGSNAHVIVEEYPPAPPRGQPAVPDLLVLSARTPERLRVYAERMLRHLRTLGCGPLTDIARTLQAGRPALPARLAVVAADVPEAVAGLERFLRGGESPAGPAVATGAAAGKADGGPAGTAAFDHACRAGDLAEAARLWVRGAMPDWRTLNGGALRRVPLPGYPFERRRFWIGGSRTSAPAIQATPAAEVAQNGAAAPAPAPAGATDTGFLADARRAFEAALVPAQEELERHLPALGRYAAAALHRRLAELDVTPGDTTVERIRQTLAVVPAYERFVDACLAVLERHGLIRRAGDRIEVMPPGDDPALLRAGLLERSPETGSFVRFVDTSLAAYPDVLSGRVPATEALFAGSRMDLMASLYRDRVYAFYSELVARFVAGAVAVRAAAGARPVRVCELGAGTGGTSRAALAALAAGGRPVEYHYTDVGGSFIVHGRREFGARYPFARFHRYDMEQEPAGQDIEPGSIDVALVVGALHAVADVDATLRRLAHLLGPSGLLVVGEAVADHDVMAVAAGLFAGWTRYADPERRLPHSPLLSEAGWAAAFRRAGFTGFTAYGPGLTADATPGHRVMVAARPDAAVLPVPTPSPAHSRASAAGAGPAPAGPGVDSVRAPATMATPPVAAASLPAAASGPGDDAELDEDEVAARCEPLVAEIVAASLSVSPEEIDPEESFASFGVDSILAVSIVRQLNETFGMAMKPTVLFDYPSVRDLAFFLVSEGARPPAPSVPPPAAANGADALPTAAGAGPAGPLEAAGPDASGDAAPAVPAGEASAATARVTAPSLPAAALARAPRATSIAVIGIAARYPGAEDYRQLWHNIAAGRDAVTEVPQERWDIDSCYQPGAPVPGKTYSRWGGYLTDVDRFDPLFFGISPAEADLADPQQRLFLEESWHAIEDAGLDARGLRGLRCGVFTGAPPSDYLGLIKERGRFAHYGVFTGNSPAILPARIAYHLDITGPCLAVDTACSSSLVAIHQACRSLADGECDLAIAGGVAVFATLEHHQLSASVGMLSPTGRCRPFDAAADGLAVAEGVGVVLLKRLDDALADGDPIHGVIRGSGINQDGRTNGITAPSARSQTALELEVYQRFGVDPETIGYVEAHGTGTRLGDPIEVEALTAAFRHYTGRRGFVPIGSLKANIGHTSHAAGVGGLIKVLLAMQSRQIPPLPHFTTPNPLIGFEDTPFFVPTELMPWPAGGPRRAAVSSFGFSGTNGHLIVDEHPDARPRHTPPPTVLLPLSAQTEESLRWTAGRLAAFLAEQPDADPHEVAATLHAGRAVFEHRLAILAPTVDDLRERLALAAAGGSGPGLYVGRAEPARVTVRAARTSGEDLAAVASAWVAGRPADASGTAGQPHARRVHLPGYVFARERCWVPGPDTPGPVPATAPPGPGAVADDRLAGRAEEYLKGILAAEARLPVERLRSRAPLEDYGVESVLIARLNRRLEDDFGEMPSTLFFEYQTIGELADYFAREHAERITALSAAGPATADPAAVAAADPAPTPAAPASGHDAAVRPAATTVPAGRQDPPELADIAVIGMAGRFPQAASVDELWQNLVAGRDCITEIPPERWDHSQYLSDDPDEPGTTYARWGGFMDGVDRFDARFFGISPKDAESMDPQQRLFLETSWAALEDAGYPPGRARRTACRRGTRDVGVFAGVTYGEYQLLVGIPIAGYWAVANRVSYHFGFNGPSLAVDTACSSSLTAVHLACESLRHGECGYALAGGVNVTIHPGKYLLLGLGGWASSDGRCRTFGAGGDGYVPGEGVATLLLKPLRDAIADGDRVYGVIRASETNQDGRTNGFTVPSPNAQADLITEALTTAGIGPRAVSYIEAHGTGTALGDPIEVAGLTRAFRRSTEDRGFCAVGSVKSAIGHLEAAAGVTGLVKVLLQLRHDTIAPSLHASPPNPNLDFTTTPFRVAHRTQAWSRDPGGAPRVAAVSSFGAGGSNAHVILSDPPPAVDAGTATGPAEAGPHLLLLSARQPERLAEQARNLAVFLTSEPGRATGLADVAWTLTVGRQPFEHRLAVVATTHEEAAARLAAFAEGHAPDQAVTGVVDSHEEAGGESAEDVEYLRTLAARGALARLGKLWVQGWTLDWEALADAGGVAAARGRTVSLPAYPFARDRYWIDPADYQRPGHAPSASPPVPVPAAAPAPAPGPAAPAPAVGSQEEMRDELERRMKNIFADLTKLPVAELDVHADFLDFGFDSVVTVRMLNRLMKSYGVQIPGTAIEEHTTIRSFADHVIDQGYITGERGVDGVDPRIMTVVSAPARQPERLVRDEPFPVSSIFITGVTGVLGGRLLYDLLAETDVRITCLVRNRDVAAARERVRYFLDVYDAEGRLTDAFSQRVEIVLGDVSQERMGLDEDTLAQLAATTDLTLHAAARTTLVGFYDQLAPVNVAGTRRAIDFALRTRHKYLVYVSSFSALGDWQIYGNPPYRETDIELGQGYDHLPYQQTKYHAEKMVRAATEEGLVWNIVRPGNIMGDSRTGRYPFAEVTVKGVFYDIFKTIAETGLAMLSPNAWDVSPVDYVSAGLLHIALRRPSYRETYHLTNPDIRSLFDIFSLIGDFGYPIRPVSIEEFHRQATMGMFRRHGSDEPYESQTIEMVKYGVEIWGREHYEQAAWADSAYTRSVLGPAGIHCPTIAELVPGYLGHCIEAGYLTPPPAAGTPVASPRLAPAARPAATGTPPAATVPAAAGWSDADADGRPVGVVFPGQGAQRPGMGRDYYDRFARARETFAEASEATEEDLARICFEDGDRLRLTEFTQPCLLTAEIAAYRVATEEFGLRADVFGGHSVGEYTALVAAGVIPLPDAVRLVRRRGALMQGAVPAGGGGMAALIADGIDDSGALAIVAALGVEMANRNSPQQVAVSGTTAGLDRLRRILAEALPDLDYVPLKVSAPFHSRFMRPAEEEFGAALRECAARFDVARATAVTSNLTGGFHDPAGLVDHLVGQLSAPVRWQDNMAAIAPRAGRIVEIGPRGSLSKFFHAVGCPVTPITSVAEAEERLGVLATPSPR